VRPNRPVSLKRSTEIAPICIINQKIHH
jgi:hypothetical protein